MSSADIAEEIRTSFPGAEEIIVQYLSGYLVDDASEDDDVLQVAREMLGSLAAGRNHVLETLMLRLGVLLEDQLRDRMGRQAGPKLLDKVLVMGTGAMSNTIVLSEGVDLESINKAKCVHHVVRSTQFLLHLFLQQSLASRCQEARETGGEAQSWYILTRTHNS
jgi:ATP-binding cassette, subfamily F, member 3